MEINKKLKDILEDHDTNQTKLAQAIGVNRKQIGRWIRGEQEMGINKLKEICLYFEVSADYLLDLPETLNWPRKEKTNEEKTKSNN